MPDYHVCAVNPGTEQPGRVRPGETAESEVAGSGVDTLVMVWIGDRKEPLAERLQYEGLREYIGTRSGVPGGPIAP